MRVNMEHPLMTLVEAPILRIAELPAWTKIIATFVAGIVTAIFGDMFGGIFAIYFMTSALDYAFGRRAAKKNRGAAPYSSYVPELARIGVQTKMASLMLVFVVWILCLWAMEHLATRGISEEVLMWVPLAPTLLALAGVIDDLDSIYDHQRRLGGRPNRLFKTVIRGLRLIPDKLTGLVHSEEDDDSEIPAGQEHKP